MLHALLESRESYLLSLFSYFYSCFCFLRSSSPSSFLYLLCQFLRSHWTPSWLAISRVCKLLSCIIPSPFLDLSIQLFHRSPYSFFGICFDLYKTCGAFKLYFHVCGCCACMCARESHPCQVPSEIRRDWILWNWGYKCLLAFVWCWELNSVPLEEKLVS